METLTYRAVEQANAITEKEVMLGPECVPQNEHTRYFVLPLVGIAHQSITNQADERALFAQSVGNTPAPHQMSSGALHLLWEWEKERIMDLVNAVIRAGLHPAVWNQASRVAICKHG